MLPSPAPKALLGLRLNTFHYVLMIMKDLCALGMLHKGVRIL